MLSLLLSAELTGFPARLNHGIHDSSSSLNVGSPTFGQRTRSKNHTFTPSRNNTRFLEVGARPTLCGNASFARAISSVLVVGSTRPFYETQGDNEMGDKTHSASIVNGPHAYEGDEKGKGSKVIEIDCRGLEFTEFKPDGEWEAKGIDSSTPFTGIDLSEGECSRRFHD
ncbi:DUF866 domain protein [Aspergillus fumigatus A1163]|uniref:DUF866 domain protein n=1 Tax=Aspergillus fumigatus (strain CBS 144.89 / FGSC A1163 / CEA10) TaxID=451804 RepID=B0XUK0_ASPFC|nr:DUF866 domain protein [Aspergillus fumigatus A1163]